MKHTKLSTLGMGGLFISLSIISGCSKAVQWWRSSSTFESKGTSSKNPITVQLSSPVEYLDPAFIRTPGEHWVAQQIYDSPMIEVLPFIEGPAPTTKSVRISPVLLSEVPMSNGEKQIHRLLIAPGNLFGPSHESGSNLKNTELCASDFLFAWKRLALLGARTSSTQKFLISIEGMNAWMTSAKTLNPIPIKEFQTSLIGLSTIGCHELVIKTLAPVDNLSKILTDIALTPLPAYLFDALTVLRPLTNRLPGTGVYELARWSNEKEIILQSTSLAKPRFISQYLPDKESSKSSDAILPINKKIQFLLNPQLEPDAGAIISAKLVKPSQEETNEANLEYNHYTVHSRGIFFRLTPQTNFIKNNPHTQLAIQQVTQLALLSGQTEKTWAPWSPPSNISEHGLSQKLLQDTLHRAGFIGTKNLPKLSFRFATHSNPTPHPANRDWIQWMPESDWTNKLKDQLPNYLKQYGFTMQYTNDEKADIEFYESLTTPEADKDFVALTLDTQSYISKSLAQPIVRTSDGVPIFSTFRIE